MDLFKANIFKAGILRQAKYLVSSPSQSARVAFFSETGVASLELLPLSIGYVVSEKTKMAWSIIQKLKVEIEGVEGLATPISERSRIPLDPYNKLTEEEKKKMASPDFIHAISYARAFANLRDPNIESANGKVVMKIIWILGALIAMGILGLMVKGVSL